MQPMILHQIRFAGMIFLVALLIVGHYQFFLPLIRRQIANRLAIQLQFRSERCGAFDLMRLEESTALVLSTILQFPLLLVCWALLPLRHEMLRMPSLLDLLAAFMLGAAEFACASFFGFLAMRVMMVVSPSLPRQDNYWLVLLRSGWMRLFQAGKELLGRWGTALIVSVYVAIEEILFRGVLLNALLRWGQIAAVILSAAAFVGYQFFNMPAKRSAMFPASGAMVVGLVNGVIVASGGSLIVAVIAHIIVFMIVAFTY